MKNDTKTAIITAKRNSRILLIGSEDLGHWYIDWNVVSSRTDRVKQAR
ncbi:MAG TPA: hypothetical protein VL020_06420 [Pseudomonadales bacterium]|nr:hypothetical protein [Pseudomonadales bacterium]